MGQVTITIDKREYAIMCEDGQEGHIVKLSRLLDQRAKQISAGARSINENMLLALVGLTLADELQDIQDGLCIKPEDVKSVDAILARGIDSQTNKIKHLVDELQHG